MVKLGRPFTYQSEEERPVTVSLRIPRDLAEQMKRYSARHRQSVTDILLDGLKWRLEQEDPRAQSIRSIEYYDNTVLQELSKPAHLVDESIPFDEDIASVPGAPDTLIQPPPDISHYDNTVIQENASGVKETRTPHAPAVGQRGGGQYKLNRRQVSAMRAKRQRGVPIKALMEEYGLSKATVFRYLAAADE